MPALLELIAGRIDFRSWFLFRKNQSDQEAGGDSKQHVSVLITEALRPVLQIFFIHNGDRKIRKLQKAWLEKRINGC